MKINNKVLFIILFILIILSISGAVFVFQDKVLFLKDWIINIKKGKDKDLNQGPIAQKIPQTPNVNQYKDIKIFIGSINPKIKIIEKPRSDHHYPYPEDFQKFLLKSSLIRGNLLPLGCNLF